MNHPSSSVSLAVGLVALLGGAVIGCSTPVDATVAVSVPAALDPGPGNRLLGTVAATGVQIYECRAAAGGAPAWAFVAPQAQLFDVVDRQRRSAGDHGAGPYWAAGDGSRIVGSVRARVKAPVAGAVPWLLLDTHSTGGPGRLAAVTRVQRVATVGGIAPATGCDAARLGARAEVPYRADYRLFVPA